MEEILKNISRVVMVGDEIQTRAFVQKALEKNVPELTILQEGLVDGIQRTGEKWQCNEYFLPDVILSAEAFKIGFQLIDPAIKKKQKKALGKKCVIGVVEGDMHELGKGLVCTMLVSSGFEVIDLGINVPKEIWLSAVATHKPQVLGLGAYMTTTMLQMKEIISAIEEKGYRKNLKIIIGGVPTSQEFCDEIGADAWGRDAVDALQKTRLLAGGE